MMAKTIVRQPLQTGIWPLDRKFLYMLERACHVQAPTDSPYIGRVTVMVVPSFSLLFKAMVP